MSLLRLLPLLFVTQPSPATTPSPACTGCRVDVEQVRRSYSDDDWSALTHGEVRTSERRRSEPALAVRSDVEAAAIIPFPAAQVWDVVVDFESRPRFIPGAKEMHIVRVDGNQVWLAEHLRVQR